MLQANLHPSRGRCWRRNVTATCRELLVAPWTCRIVARIAGRVAPIGLRVMEAGSLRPSALQALPRSEEPRFRVPAKREAAEPAEDGPKQNGRLGSITPINFRPAPT